MMRKKRVLRAGVLGAALLASAAGAGWEVNYESGGISLSGLDLKNWPTGYCLGYEAPDGAGGGYD